jgi:broad specificity phosphatase PhoE
MSSIVVLCRHGNTFNKGDKVVMVGAREDLPLTAFGEEQAKQLGASLREAAVMPSRIISGPLKRTKVFATIVAEETAASEPVKVDSRLIEFDYGAWSGLSDQEIVALSGEDALLRWQNESLRPKDVTFYPSVEMAQVEADLFLSELSELSGCTVVVTSNGRLREFGHLLAAAHAGKPKSFKVKTGHSCVLTRSGGAWKIVGWDLSPEELREELGRISGPV